MTDQQIAALSAEIANDPAGIGYADSVGAGDNAAIVDLLNEVRAEIQVDRETVESHEVYEAMVPAEWTALSAAEKQRVQTVLSMGRVNVQGTNTRASLAAAFGPATVTRANLLAMQQRDGSRAEQLFGFAVTIEDVRRAREGA